MGDGVVGLVLVGLIGYLVLRRIRGREERAKLKEAQRRMVEKAEADRKRWLESPPVAATAAVAEVKRIIAEGRHEDAIAFGKDVIGQLRWFESEEGRKALKRSGRPAGSPRSSDLLEKCARVDLMLAVAESQIDVAERTASLGLASEACRLAVSAIQYCERKRLTTFGYEDPGFTQRDICSRRADLYIAQGKPVPDERR